MIGRVFAWLFIALGLGAAARDVLAFLEHGTVGVSALGQIWFAVDPGSLNLVQAVVERYIHPVLWDPIIFSLLRLPAAPVFLAIGIALLFAFRRRTRRRGRSSFS